MTKDLSIIIGTKKYFLVPICKKEKQRKKKEKKEERVVIFKKEVLGWGVSEYQQILFHIPLCLFPTKKKSLRNNQGK